MGAGGTGTRVVRWRVFAWAFAALLVAGAVPASAATVRVVIESPEDEPWEEARFQAAVGETNRVVVTTSGERLAFRDSGAPLRTGSQCGRGPGPGVVTCSSQGDFNFHQVDLGDRNDVAMISGTVLPATAKFGRYPAFTVWGGPGNDRITIGANAVTFLSAGLKNRGAIGGPGNDVLTGGPLRDRLVGGPGADRINGGGSSDTTSYLDHVRPVRVNLSRTGPQGSPGENDMLISIEHVIGGRAGDVIVGNASPNILAGEGGNDTFHAVAGGVDTINCGPGVDTVRADAADRTFACERVTRS